MRKLVPTLVLSLLFISTIFAGVMHTFYFSFTTVRMAPQQNSIQIEMRMFTDDLERALSTSAKGEKIHLGAEHESDGVDLLLEDYLREHFSIKINGSSSNLRYWGKEVDFDLTWCYLELITSEPVEVIEITNTCLMEIFPEQVNETAFEINGWSKRIQLTSKLPSQVITP